ALLTLGVRPAAVHVGGEVSALDSTPCFADPASGEVVAAGRKLIGSAQVRIAGVLLQHGSLPLGPSPRLARLPPAMAAALDGEPAYLSTLTAASRQEIVGAFVAMWAEALGPLHEQPFTSDERREATAIRSKYRNPAWTWRR